MQSRLHFQLIVEREQGMDMLQWGPTDHKPLLKKFLLITFWNSALVLDIDMKIK